MYPHNIESIPMNKLVGTNACTFTYIISNQCKCVNHQEQIDAHRFKITLMKSYNGRHTRMAPSFAKTIHIIYIILCLCGEPVNRIKNP